MVDNAERSQDSALYGFTHWTNPHVLENCSSSHHYAEEAMLSGIIPLVVTIFHSFPMRYAFWDTEVSCYELWQVVAP